MIQRINAATLEHLVQECLAQCGRQMIDQAGDAQIVVADNCLIGIKYLAHFQCHLRLLEGAGEFLDVVDDSTNAHIDTGIELAAERVCNGTCQLFQVLFVDSAFDLLDQNDVGFRNIGQCIITNMKKILLAATKVFDKTISF